MEQVHGFAKFCSTVMIQQLQTKPLFGKPYLRYGQCFVLLTQMVQLGAVLGAKYRRGNLDVFANAFAGAVGDHPGAAAQHFKHLSNRLLESFLDSATFYEYVAREEAERLRDNCDLYSLLAKRGIHKILLPHCYTWTVEYALDGACLGVMHPEEARRMFDASQQIVDKDRWHAARAAGVDIPSEQEQPIDYEEEEAAQNDGFLQFCREYRPSINVKLLAA